MDELELEQLRRNPKWAVLLTTYNQQALQQRNQSKEFDGWVPRIHESEEIPVAELSAIHGKLIAFGFLKFDLAGRDGGIRYQLTPLGKQGINVAVPVEEDESEEPNLTVHAEPIPA
jgi:hypothetical protein